MQDRVILDTSVIAAIFFHSCFRKRKGPSSDYGWKIIRERKVKAECEAGIDEFDKLDVGAEKDFNRIKYRILQDLRAILSIEGVYLILIGLEKHSQFEVKDEKAIEDSAFDDIIHLTSDNEEAHHVLSGILERRLNWLNLNELFDESGKEEMVKRAKGSPRELIKYLNMRNYFS